MKRLLLFILTVAVCGIGATHVPAAKADGYTEAQLQALASTPSPAYDDSMSLGTPAYSPDYWRCWDDVREQYHGTWPQEQATDLHTHWCGSGPDGNVMTRSSYVTMHSTWCSAHDPYERRVGGGVGTRYVDVRAGAYFDCPMAPWISTHWHIWLVVRYWGGGGVQVIARCCS